MSRTSDCREYQEIVAALLLPGPLEANGKSGWNVRELTAACPAVPEPHRASQILYDLSKLRVTMHVGGGTATRHYLYGLPHGGPLQNALQAEYLQGCPQKWHPSRDILMEIAKNRGNVLASLREIPKGGAHVQQWIWDAWEASAAVPLTKKEILSTVLKTRPNCQEHVVSQQLLEMVRTGKLRQHKESGKAVAFIPVREPDLFTPINATEGKSAVQTADDLCPEPAKTVTTESVQMGGILPEVSIYLGDEDGCDGVTHDREVRAFVALDANGNIRSIRIGSGMSDNLLLPCA